MWHVLDKQWLTGLVTLVIAAVLLCFHLLGISYSDDGVWNYASKLVTTVAAVLFLIGKWGWKPLWLHIPSKIRLWLNQQVCPNLNGTWQGTLRSNFGLTEPTGALSPRIDAEVEIDADWLAIRMRLKTKRPEPDDTGSYYSRSWTQLMLLEKNPATDSVDDKFRLWYVYSNETPRPVPGDQNSHIGAAYLSVYWDNDKPVLKGHYWTDRCWHGCPDPDHPGALIKNTAGEIELRRMTNPNESHAG